MRTALSTSCYTYRFDDAPGGRSVQGRNNVRLMANGMGVSLETMKAALGEYVKATPIDEDVWRGDVGALAMGMSNYKTDWRDTLRHFSNLAFVGSYLFFERGKVSRGLLHGNGRIAPSP